MAIGLSDGRGNPAALPATTLPLLDTESDAADPQVIDILPITVAAPWGAVGFIDNGCTGILIDSQHVLTAAHCLTFDYDVKTADGKMLLHGAWQTGLTFFPNYHPDRLNPPRHAIDRVIVGSRIQEALGPNSAGADWGIAHLATPVAGFPSVPLAPIELWQFPGSASFTGYARDPKFFPRGAKSYPEPQPKGFCANFKQNCWWTPALRDPNCVVLGEANGLLQLDAFSCRASSGGDSGAPIIWNASRTQTPAFRVAAVNSGPGFVWSASRFVHAPRYAASVAAAPYDDGSLRTQVFVADSDRGRIVSRYRSDKRASGPFVYFRDLGAVPGPGALTAFRLPNGRPQVIVVSQTTKLVTSHVAADGAWQPWQPMAGPPGVAGFLDVAAAASSAGLPRLYVVGSDGEVYATQTSGAPSDGKRGAWAKLAAGVPTKRVAAVGHRDGRQQVFVLSPQGALRSLWQSDAAAAATWSAADAFDGGSLPALVDIDATWTVDGRVQVFAVDANGDMWTRTATGRSPTDGWSAWARWSVPRYAPRASSPPKLDGIVSLAATRWLESGATVLPVVFATDSQGNVYVTSQGSGGWQPWRSFYN